MDSIQRLALQIVPFFMAVIFHEVAHGWVANQWGDSTAKDQGRLTFNPMPHLDVVGTVILPVLMMSTGSGLLFGWAKPVPIDPSRFRKFRPGLFWVSAAGPLMNFLLATVSAFGFALMNRFLPESFSLSEPLVGMAYISVSLNFSLGIFNLLPIPPLDGSKIIESFLSYTALRKYEALAQYGFWILLALLMTGALSILSSPITFLTRLVLGFAISAVGLPAGGLTE
ncbi:MAG: site-2 protease family protein [Oligoflexia bacterium]